MVPVSLYFVRLVEARQRRQGAADRKDNAKEKSMKKIQSFFNKNVSWKNNALYLSVNVF